ncbi:MAG: TRAP transporter small permease subunit [Oceanobacter sp.]
MSHSLPQENTESLPPGRVALADCIDRAIVRVGKAVAWIFFVLMLVILAQVILRRGFSAGMIVLEELQWHLYAIGVFIGVVYAQATDSHVRVDVLRSHFGDTARHLIEIFGILLLLMPFLWVMLYHGYEFVYESWRIGERSLAPAGLPWRWAIKSLIPLTMALMMLAALNRVYREVVMLGRHWKGEA